MAVFFKFGDEFVYNGIAEMRILQKVSELVGTDGQFPTNFPLFSHSWRPEHIAVRPSHHFVEVQPVSVGGKPIHICLRELDGVVASLLPASVQRGLEESGDRAKAVLVQQKFLCFAPDDDTHNFIGATDLVSLREWKVLESCLTPRLLPTLGHG